MILCLIATALAAEPAPGPELPSATAPRAELPQPPALSADQAVAFGDHLLAQGDAYNALTWYRLALFLDPQRPDAEALRFRVGLAYERGERYPAAVFAYGQVGGPLADRAAYRAAIADHRAGNEAAADLGLERVGVFYPGSEWAPRADFARGIFALQRYDLETAQTRFAAFSHPESPLAPRAAELATAASEPVPRKSPALAASLSVVPGLGQLYAGHPGDAMMAALFNVPLALGAGLLLADGVEQQRPTEIAAGAVLGSVFVVAFYPSNVIGAWRGAERTNQMRERRRSEALLQQAWAPDLELDAGEVEPP